MMLTGCYLVLLNAQAGDCTSNHQLLNLRGAFKDDANLGETDKKRSVDWVLIQIL
jgi:hypothetical protein